LFFLFGGRIPLFALSRSFNEEAAAVWGSATVQLELLKGRAVIRMWRLMNEHSLQDSAEEFPERLKIVAYET